MQDSDRRRFGQLLAMLGAAFRTELGEDLIEGYWIGLASMQIQAFERAVKLALEQCKFMPVPAELRDLAFPKKPQHFGQPPSFGPGHWAWELSESKEREERRRLRAASQQQTRPESVGELMPALLAGLGSDGEKH